MLFYCPSLIELKLYSFSYWLVQFREEQDNINFLETCRQTDILTRISDVVSRFSDDGITYHGAYGPKIRDQLHYAADALMQDRDTRQAVINIWRECPGQTADVPCTLSVQFIVRNDTLHVIDTMRSSDLWLGWPYDIFNFSMLARYMLLYTGADWNLGQIYLNAGSMHLYKPQWEAADDIINSNLDLFVDVDIPFQGMKPDSFVDSLWEAAHGNLLAPHEG